MMRIRMTGALVAATLVLAGAPAAGQNARAAQNAPATRADTAAVLATVQKMFDGMAQGDSAAVRSVLLPGIKFVVIGADTTVGIPRMQGDTGFVHAVGTRPQRMLERMWSPIVHIQGLVATVWTPYDFHNDKTFSHCGVDMFTLMRTPDGWKIVTLAYTAQRVGCAPSPLGPPK